MKASLRDKSSRAPKVPLIAALVVCGLLTSVSPAAASSAAFCVQGSIGGACPAGSTAQPTIEAAAAAASEAGSTTIYLTAGTHQAASTFNLGNKPVRLIGLGETRPVLTAPAATGAAVISTTSALAKLEHVSIAIPASTGMAGLRASNGGQAVIDVRVTGPQAASSIGIELTGPNPSISSTTVELDGVDGGSTGVKLDGVTTGRVADLSVTGARTGIRIENSINFAIRRAQLLTIEGVVVRDSDGSVASTLISPPASAAASASAVAVDVLSDGSSATSVNLFNCTLIHEGASGGSGVRSTATGGAAPLVVTVDSSIVSGFGDAAFRAVGSGGSARTTLRYSHYDGTRSTVGDGLFSEGPGNHSGTVDYGFVDRQSGNFRLRLDSALVDRGNPDSGGFTQADSGSDLDRLPRVVGRGAGSIRDVGAYEVQNRAPTPDIRVVTAVPSTTSATEFSAAGSTDADGDQLTFEWGFDGLPGPTGTVVQKRFLTAGPHIVRLTATDHTGVSTTILRQFDVATGFLAVKLRSQSARLSRSGTFHLRVTCPDSAISDCTGRLELRTAEKVDAKRYSRRGHRQSRSKATHLKAADQFFRIAPGTTSNVQVRASRTFRNVLAVERRFKLTGGLVDATTMNALLRSNRASFTINAPSAKSRR